MHTLVQAAQLLLDASAGTKFSGTSIQCSKGSHFAMQDVVSGNCHKEVDRADPPLGWREQWSRE